MKHPNDATLALHAGGDLGLIARWRTERHLAKCPRCQDELAAFDSLREILPELAETPEVPWNRLAAEMKANIRLGLAAGECVREGPRPWLNRPALAGMRAVVAFASVIALLVTGLVLQRPAPITVSAASVEVRSLDGGIQVREGGETLRLLHGVPAGNEKSVTYMPSAQGSIGSRYVDPQTGYVTVANVYAD
ncbi:MAG: hypothetical protein LAQ30_16450 [Acidobacteriia bacterium]|nr:hypothetical protein [Terriglobia bacterium]